MFWKQSSFGGSSYTGKSRCPHFRLQGHAAFFPGLLRASFTSSRASPGRLKYIGRLSGLAIPTCLNPSPSKRIGDPPLVPKWKKSLHSDGLRGYLPDSRLQLDLAAARQVKIRCSRISSLPPAFPGRGVLGVILL